MNMNMNKKQKIDAIHYNWSDLEYISGFGSEINSEVLKGALPVGQNNPQKCPYGLYAEQLSGTAFTVPRKKNKRSWLYRILPPVIMNNEFKCMQQKNIISDFSSLNNTPQQYRWNPISLPNDIEKVDFIEGIHTICGAGEPTVKAGMAIHLYSANYSMHNKAFYNSDGDFLIVPQTGKLKILTEFGKMAISPNEICVIQRDIRFSVFLDGASRGYILEVYDRHFDLPDLGPIGANGLANPRDFLHPIAFFEDRECEFSIVTKHGGQLFTSNINHSPFNVVAWHGNYIPYKYDLERFCTISSVSYDHTDPSIYTVLTVPSNEPGVATCDFVIFPPRWMVQEKTFRPPYYHRNCMCEFMGMIYGQYDAKKSSGFLAGSSSLHNCGTPHGPDADSFISAYQNDTLKPVKFTGGLAFMFETNYMVKLTDYAIHCNHIDTDYWKCWQDLPKLYNHNKK